MTFWHLQWNLDDSNTDGSFTLNDSNSFLSPDEVLPIAQENKYLGKLSYFIMKLYMYVVCLMSTQHTVVVQKIKKTSVNYHYFASWPSAMINPQWLELLISRINFHGPEDVRATEILLYF